MADGADALEGVEIDESRQEGVEEQPEKQPTIEDLALEVGWKPQDQWKGDGWMPAADYLRSGREGRDSNKRELRAVRDELQRVTRTAAQILEDQLAAKDAQLAALQARAVEEGDNSEVDRIVSKRLELKNQAPSQPQIAPEAYDFQERNKDWFGVDPLATLRAQQLSDALAKAGYDVPTQLREVERAMRKEFPEHFKAATTPKDPPGTQTGASRATTGGSKPKGFADMPAESQKMAAEYERRHGIKKEDFAKSYWADQAKTQRRA